VANCFARDQSSAFVEASLGDCYCQRQSIRIQSRQSRNPIRVQIAVVSSVSEPNDSERVVVVVQ
jgi:hypothetical protein